MKNEDRMSDEELHGHLTADLQRGGHGLSEASRTVVWDVDEEFHTYDHTAKTWFSEALLHAHPTPPPTPDSICYVNLVPLATLVPQVRGPFPPPGGTP